jgi:hypothetical protein
MFTILFPLRPNLIEVHLGCHGTFPNLSLEYAAEHLQVFREVPPDKPYLLTQMVRSRARSGLGASARNYTSEEYTLNDPGTYGVHFLSDDGRTREHHFEWGLDNGRHYVSFLGAPVGTRIVTDNDVFIWSTDPIRLYLGENQVQRVPIEPPVLPKTSWERLGEDDIFG